jgi:hypothetical protein
MSAFICNPEHIGLLAAYAVKYQGTHHDSAVIYPWRTAKGFDEDAANVARNLMKANIAGVAHRYPNDRDGQRPGPQFYDNELEQLAELWARHYHRNAPSVESVGILKMCQCFDYQACELPDYNSTEAAQQIDWIKGKAIRALSGYDDAPYEWSAPDEAIPHGIQAFMNALEHAA